MASVTLKLNPLETHAGRLNSSHRLNFLDMHCLNKCLCESVPSILRKIFPSHHNPIWDTPIWDTILSLILCDRVKPLLQQTGQMISGSSPIFLKKTLFKPFLFAMLPVNLSARLNRNLLKIPKIRQNGNRRSDRVTDRNRMNDENLKKVCPSGDLSLLTRFFKYFLSQAEAKFSKSYLTLIKKIKIRSFFNLGN